mmetsp:Transcript_2387/g.5717  ORF Transcript_2387/g.5717 Transcript_2387/m.5717 type:complete len:235 (+) Transcript_2387:86-790(+)
MSSDDEDFAVGDSDEENYGAPAPVPEKKKKKIEKETKKGKKKARGRSENKSGKDIVVKIEKDAGSPKKKSKRIKKEVANSLDSFDVLVPSSILNGGGVSSDNQCTLLVEVSYSKDAIALGEFGGSIGAIGRFESDPKGITLDLKGNQYRGSLLPGPTCLVVGFPQSFGAKRKDSTTEANGQPILEEEDDKEESGKLRVEGILDEYATLVQIDDHMKKLDAIVTENHNDKTEGKM